jgi:hypothetical protein
MKIDRLLFWFEDGREMLTSLNEDFFGLANLLCRLLNQRYDGKRIKFLNIYFSTEKSFEMNLNITKNESYYFGGHLHFYGEFNNEQLGEMDWTERKKFIWNKAYQYLCMSAKNLKNQKLLEAAEYAYKKGIEINLDPDYRMIEAELCVLGQICMASVWVNFRKDGMYSKFTLEKESSIVYEKQIDKTKNGVEFFLEIYKEIEVDKENIIIKGNREVDYLPLKIPFRDVAPYLK